MPSGPLGRLGLLVLVGVAIGCCSTHPGQNPEATAGPTLSGGDGAVVPDGDFLAAEVATVGWDAFSGAPIVLLRTLDSGQVVPIWVGTAEARAIASALHGVEYPRPMTHDLMRNLLGKLHAQLEEVLIHDLKDGTYYGLLKLRLDGEPEPLVVDSRPSDGLALALRTGAAIRLSSKLLTESPEFEFMAPEGMDQVVQSLGLTVVAPNDDLRQRFALPDRPGLVVIRATGEAASRGIEVGDLILEVNGKVPEEPLDLLEALRDTPPGDPLAITYWRQGQEHTVEIYPTAQPQSESRRKKVA